MIQMQSYHPSHCPVSFAGRFATEQARRQSLGFGFQMDELLKQDTDPYLGDVPDALLQASGLDAETALKSLDRIVAGLRKESSLRATWQRNVSRFAFKPLKKQVQLQSVGKGAFGEVYRLTLGQQVYALKVFHNLKDRISASKEAANGLFINTLGASDVVRFHAANPMRGWLLLEYIDPARPRGHRPGKTLGQLGYVMGDSATPENYINGIRVDLGGSLDRRM